MSGDQMIQPTIEERAVRALEADIASLIQDHLSARADWFGPFDDANGLANAISEAIFEITGSDRTFEDGIRQFWSPVGEEQFPFSCFISEVEAMFWAIRAHLLRDHAKTIQLVRKDALGSFLEHLDTTIRREILHQIENQPFRAKRLVDSD
jgi:hypothetical protein